MDNHGYDSNAAAGYPPPPNYSDLQQNTKTQASNAYGQPPAYYPPAQPVQPQYGYGLPANFSNQNISNTTVIGVQPVARQPGTIIVAQSHVVFQPPNYMCLSCCTVWFINFIFGLIAFMFSLMSSSAFGEGKIEKARSHGKVALYLNFAGMVTSAILYMVLIIVLASD